MPLDAMELMALLNRKESSRKRPRKTQAVVIDDSEPEEDDAPRLPQPQQLLHQILVRSIPVCSTSSGPK